MSSAVLHGLVSGLLNESFKGVYSGDDREWLFTFPLCPIPIPYQRVYYVVNNIIVNLSQVEQLSRLHILGHVISPLPQVLRITEITEILQKNYSRH